MSTFLEALLTLAGHLHYCSSKYSFWLRTIYSWVARFLAIQANQRTKYRIRRINAKCWSSGPCFCSRRWCSLEGLLDFQSSGFHFIQYSNAELIDLIQYFACVKPLINLWTLFFYFSKNVTMCPFSWIFFRIPVRSIKRSYCVHGIL